MTFLAFGENSSTQADNVLTHGYTPSPHSAPATSPDIVGSTPPPATGPTPAPSPATGPGPGPSPTPGIGSAPSSTPAQAFDTETSHPAEEETTTSNLSTPSSPLAQEARLYPVLPLQPWQPHPLYWYAQPPTNTARRACFMKVKIRVCLVYPGRIKYFFYHSLIFRSLLGEDGE